MQHPMRIPRQTTKHTHRIPFVQVVSLRATVFHFCVVAELRRRCRLAQRLQLSQVQVDVQHLNDGVGPEDTLQVHDVEIKCGTLA